jgi:hypothetical protein
MDSAVKTVQNAPKAKGLYLFDFESHLVLSRVMLQEIPVLQVRNL